MNKNTNEWKTEKWQDKSETETESRVRTQPCLILTGNKVHSNVTTLHDDIQTLYQTSRRPQETATICCRTAIGKACAADIMVLGKAANAKSQTQICFID